MNKDPKQILLKVLITINYNDSKEEFINNFLKLCGDQAIVSLLQTLPVEKQTLIKTRADLEKYFTKEQISKSLEKSTKDNFQSYLQAIIPTLNEVQSTQLNEYFKSLG